MKKFLQLMLCLFLLVLFACPMQREIVISGSTFPPLEVTPTTNFIMSEMNRKIYGFDTATDKIVATYPVLMGDHTECIRLPNSPYLYFDEWGGIVILDIARGKSKKIPTDTHYHELGQYSSTEVLVCNLYHQDPETYSKLDGNGKLTPLDGTYSKGFTIDGKDYIVVDNELLRLSDNKKITVSKDNTSNLSKDSKFKYIATDIGKNIIKVRYSCLNDDGGTEYKSAVFIYSNLDTNIDLATSIYMGDFATDYFSNDISFEYADGNLYVIEKESIEKYDTTTKSSSAKLELAEGKFSSGVNLISNSLIIGSSLYCSLGNYEESKDDMIVKVNLSTMTHEIIKR